MGHQLNQDRLHLINLECLAPLDHQLNRRKLKFDDFFTLSIFLINRGSMSYGGNSGFGGMSGSGSSAQA